MKDVLIICAITFGSWVTVEFIKFQKVEQVRIKQEECAWVVLGKWQRGIYTKPQANKLLKNCGDTHGWGIK